MKVSNVGLEDPTILQQKIHGHNVPSYIGVDLIIISDATNNDDSCSLPYPYTWKITYYVTETIADVLYAGMYMWDKI